MPKKSCKHCGIVNFNHVCPVVTKEKNERDAKREDKSIYWSSRWRKLRAEVLKYQDYICLWSLYIDGVIREANTGHRIVTLMDDESLAYDIENVIGLNEDVHDTIHELYKTDKNGAMELLRECMRLWDIGVRLDGLGMLQYKLSVIDTPPM